MPWIQNYSLADVVAGNHRRANGGVLIRISDPDVNLRKANLEDDFGVIHHFWFYDHDYSEGGITQSQGDMIASILTDCLQSNTSIIVHCTAGICRSGAVVECAKMIGFDVLRDNRIPNVRVKKAIMYALGLGYEGVI